MRRRFLSLIITAGLLVAADGKQKADLVGSWDLVSSAVDGGKPSRNADFKTVLIISDDKYILHVAPAKSRDSDNPGSRMESTYKVDPTGSPATLDIKPLTGPDKGKTIRAIYLVDKDELKICQATQADKDRPSEFASKRGLLLQTFKRR
jgi:uncharacterized protein (TIGR03067 family)